MNITPGILGLDDKWKITFASTEALKLLHVDSTMPPKIEDMPLGEIIPGIIVKNSPSPETLADALSSKGLSFADYTCSADGKNFLFCITDSSQKDFSGMDFNRLYRQNKKLTAIGIFSGGIAHDYNNALTAVLGNISLAKFEAGQNSELLDLLNDAEKASMKIKVLTERLSSYSRGIKLARVKVRLEQMIDDICACKRKEFNGSINVRFNDNSSEAECDPQLISMMFECIIQNAIEAVEPGKGAIDIELKAVDVTEDEVFMEMALVQGKYIRIDISDNGPGIAADKSSDIFNPYFTTKEDHDGIGLALAYSILKRHRGFISLNSVPGRGSTFSIYIPLF